MRFILFLLWIASIGLVSITQIKFAQANYPREQEWKARLFLTGFSSGAIGPWWLLLEEFSMYKILIVIIAAGIFSGLIFTFLVPINMRSWFPERDLNE